MSLRLTRGNPGQLNRKIEIKALTQVSDGAGGFDDGLVLVTKLWANITPIWGKEYWSAEAMQDKVTHKVVVRYTKQINRTHLVCFDDKEYIIQYIYDLGDERRFLELHCIERQ